MREYRRPVDAGGSKESEAVTMAELDALPLIPRPRHVARHPGEAAVGWLAIEALPDGLSTYRDEIFALAKVVAGTPDLPVLPVTFDRFDGRPEEYTLCIQRDEVRIRATDALAALHAMRTLVDVWDSADGPALPLADIEDGPSFATRGVFVESYAGVDHMDLAEWRRHIDRLAQLKLNTLGVSIYGCWDIHHGQRSEWLFTPLDEFPELRSPRRMVTWDPATEREIEYHYLPRMFEHDFFGDIVCYARERGIDVLPQLGGPGHSTLIPRCLPELSAVDEDGNPTGYGYCVSRTTARDTLTRLIRALARQHLTPNGVRRLHVAGDEYYPIRNVDPDDRTRVVSPYCRCTGCGQLSPGQLLMEYLVLVGQVLAENDITMVHWHDTLVREGVLDDYLDRLDAAGVPEPVIAWWKYNDPVPTPRTDRAESWSCPTTGLAPFLFQLDFGPNIETVLRRGQMAGTSGAFAYSISDPSDHANVAFLADFAWNCDPSEGAASFRRRWARLICPDDPDTAGYVLSMASTITACYPLMMYLLNHVHPLFATTSPDDVPYPDGVLSAFAAPQPALGDVVRQVIETLRDALATMPNGRDVRHWPNPVTAWRNETTRMADTLDLFLAVLDAARQSEPPTEHETAQLASRATALLHLAANSKAPYVAPVALREHWGLIRDIEPVIKRLRDTDGLRPAESWYAWLL